MACCPTFLGALPIAGRKPITGVSCSRSNNIVLFQLTHLSTSGQDFSREESPPCAVSSVSQATAARRPNCHTTTIEIRRGIVCQPPARKIQKYTVLLPDRTQF